MEKNMMINNENFDEHGINERGFNEDGYNVFTNSKYDNQGFDFYGFDKDGNFYEEYLKIGGFAKVDLLSEKRFDENGLDERGFNKEGYNVFTNSKYDSQGFDVYGFDKDGNYYEEYTSIKEKEKNMNFSNNRVSDLDITINNLLKKYDNILRKTKNAQELLEEYKKLIIHNEKLKGKERI